MQFGIIGIIVISNYTVYGDYRSIKEGDLTVRYVNKLSFLPLLCKNPRHVIIFHLFIIQQRG